MPIPETSAGKGAIRGPQHPGRSRRLVQEDRVRGVTSNPAIFQREIAESRDYDVELCALSGDGTCLETPGKATGLCSLPDDALS